MNDTTGERLHHRPTIANRRLLLELSTGVASQQWLNLAPCLRDASRVYPSTANRSGPSQWETGRSSTLDFRGEFFNIFNHGIFSLGNAGFSSGYSTLTILIYGIPYTAGGYGNPTFAEYAPLVGGARHSRVFVRVTF